MIYLLHNVTEWSVQFYESEEYHIIPDLLQMKKEGKIRYFGFSCHAGPDMLDAFLTRHEGVFDFVQIQASESGSWSLSGEASLRCFRSPRRQNSERCGSGALVALGLRPVVEVLAGLLVWRPMAARRSPVMLPTPSDFCRICLG